jgi:20S proteasome alpha/beta subunit
MTLILGAKCVDGIAMVGDRKFTVTDVYGTHYVYANKILGELDGVLTGFSGDLGAFQVFTRSIKNYVSARRNEDIKRVMAEPLRAPHIGPTIDQVMLKITQLQKELYDKYSKNRYTVLIGISGSYFRDKISALYFFHSDGRSIPITETKTIGSGSQYASYFLKRYWRSDQTTMLQFAQLCDFIIRYVGHATVTLDSGVGLKDADDHPQVIFIPNDSEFCRICGDERRTLDCTPTQAQLNIFRQNSENMLERLHQIPPPWVSSG